MCRRLQDLGRRRVVSQPGDKDRAQRLGRNRSEKNSDISTPYHVVRVSVVGIIHIASVYHVISRLGIKSTDTELISDGIRGTVRAYQTVCISVCVIRVCERLRQVRIMVVSECIMRT